MQNYIMVDWAFERLNGVEKWEKIPAYQSRRDRLHVDLKGKT